MTTTTAPPSTWERIYGIPGGCSYADLPHKDHLNTVQDGCVSIKSPPRLDQEIGRLESFTAYLDRQARQACGDTAAGQQFESYFEPERTYAYAFYVLETTDPTVFARLRDTEFVDDDGSTLTARYGEPPAEDDSNKPVFLCANLTVSPFLLRREKENMVSQISVGIKNALMARKVRTTLEVTDVFALTTPASTQHKASYTGNIRVAIRHVHSTAGPNSSASTPTARTRHDDTANTGTSTISLQTVLDALPSGLHLGRPSKWYALQVWGLPSPCMLCAGYDRGKRHTEDSCPKRDLMCEHCNKRHHATIPCDKVAIRRPAAAAPDASPQKRRRTEQSDSPAGALQLTQLPSRPTSQHAVGPDGERITTTDTEEDEADAPALTPGFEAPGSRPYHQRRIATAHSPRRPDRMDWNSEESS